MTHTPLSAFADGTVLMCNEHILPSAKIVHAFMESAGNTIYFDESICVIDVKHFPDTEAVAEIGLHVREKAAFVMWGFNPAAGSLMLQFQELLLALDALKRSGVGRVMLYLPYLPCSRQYRQIGRQSLTAKMVAQQIQAVGVVHNLITIELHVTQIAGFYDIPVTHIRADTIFAPFFREQFAAEIAERTLTFLSTDVGGAPRTRDAAQNTAPDTPIALIDKRRSGPGESEAMNFVGEVLERDVIGYDDIGGSMNSLLNALSEALDYGANSAYGAIAHNVCCPTFKKGAKTKLFLLDGAGNPVIDTTAEYKIATNGMPIYTLDTLPRGDAYYKDNPDLVRVPTEPFVARLFETMMDGASISELCVQYRSGN